MPQLGPGQRRKIGAAVLATAERSDSRDLKARLTIFAATHGRYLAEQGLVEAADREVEAAAARFRACNAELDTSVDDLVRALALDGQPRVNPFRGFGVPSPAVLLRLAAAKKAKAIHQIVAAVRRKAVNNEATMDRANTADAATDAVEAAAADLERLQASARLARVLRDAIGQEWDRDLAALGRATRAARDDGRPDLHDAVLAVMRRSAPKKRRRRAKQPGAE